jgi:hypothetical protein
MNTTKQFQSGPAADEQTPAEMLDTARENASEAIEASERCVRDNPIPAILTALGGGILIGSFIGWSASESRHHQYRNLCKELAKDWQHRLHLG